MTAVQAHGEFYEHLKPREYTAVGKKEYDAINGKGGYTSSMDIVKGLHSDKNRSVKTAKGNKVDCGDILKRMNEKEYDVVVGQWRQKGDNKIFHTEYIFNITPEDCDKLWGSMKYELVEEYDTFIKSIPHGKEAQQATKVERTSRKKILADKNALMVIHPKVDSKKQRRVQCSFKIDKLIASGVKYTKKDINSEVYSQKRKIKK